MKTRIIVLLGLVALFAPSSRLRAATLDGAQIHSTSTGEGAKTVMLVHGWTCDETSWSEQIPVLARKYRVITIDLPGHGRSDQSTRPSSKVPTPGRSSTRPSRVSLARTARKAGRR